VYEYNQVALFLLRGSKSKDNVDENKSHCKEKKNDALIEEGLKHKSGNWTWALAFGI